MAMRRGSPFLPEEIMINIFKRLPVKSIVRFRCVCKDWKNLFKSPSFIEEHYHFSYARKSPLLITHILSFSPKYSFLFLLRYKNESVETEKIIPATYSTRRSCSIVGSTNGLLCLVLGYNNDGSAPSLLLVNPATREVRQVPRTLSDYRSYGASGWGFGLSPSVNDYKIVRIHDVKLDNFWAVRGAEVYSLRTGSWKEVKFGLIRGVRLRSKAVTTNGTVFWLGSLDCEDEDESRRHMIVSFDLAKEAFKLMPMPSPTSDPRTGGIVLDVYENKLAILHDCFSQRSCIDLWVLDDGGGGGTTSWRWNKKYSIGPASWELRAMCIWRNEIVCRNIRRSDGSSEDDLEYDQRRFLFKLTTDNEVKKFRVSFSVDNMSGVFNYVESLVSCI